MKFSLPCECIPLKYSVALFAQIRMLTLSFIFRVQGDTFHWVFLFSNVLLNEAPVDTDTISKDGRDKIYRKTKNKKRETKLFYRFKLTSNGNSIYTVYWLKYTLSLCEEVHAQQFSSVETFERSLQNVFDAHGSSIQKNPCRIDVVGNWILVCFYCVHL